MNDTAPRWPALMSTILTRRENPQFRSERAALRRGISSSTESWALPYVVQAMDGSREERTLTALTRCAAFAAEFTEIPFGTATSTPRGLTLGHWLRTVHDRSTQGEIPDPSKPDAFTSRIAYLHLQDLEEALASARRLLQLGASRGETGAPPLDYHRMTRMFLSWGNGVSDGSRKIRRSTLTDFYSAAPSRVASAPSDTTTEKD